ncbi:MAG TPA: glycosyltransferase [Anaerolineae bacterium]|nr:glycosyltransferase [Anaerolineae bacterium]
MINLIAFLYTLTLIILASYGLLGLLTFLLYLYHRHETYPCPPMTADQWPLVTIQLPIYNEKFVLPQLLKSVTAIDYPSHRLQIQLIDDSTDDTADLAANLVTYYQRHGINIDHYRRSHRHGYKAGALADALEDATGEFVAIFDADFQPQPDFLRRTIPYFQQRPDLGLIQTRWAHLNPDHSLLTAAQAIAMDKHFAMEQNVRHRANLFPKFNGTAGVWRRQCIDDSGGWEDDTVCEDLCLSTRAVLNGWQVQFLNDVTAPAELPTSALAYKSQQARWAKGSFQCLLKFGRTILTTPNHPFPSRFYGFVAMSAYLAQPLVLILLLLHLPLVYANYPPPEAPLFFGLASLGQPLLFLMSQKLIYSDWLARLRHFPTLIIVAIGIAPSNTRAILQALIPHRHHPFVRTPKQGHQTKLTRYRLSSDYITLIEISLALYALIDLFVVLWRGHYHSLFLPTTSFLGLSYIAYLSWQESRPQPVSPPQPAENTHHPIA